jgi:hypothetical protein
MGLGHGTPERSEQVDNVLPFVESGNDDDDTHGRRCYNADTIQALMRQVPALPVVGSFAERLLASDLPDLPPPARREVVAFIARRVDGLPSFTRFGVFVLGSVFRALLAVPGGWSIARLVMKLPLPLVSEYPRLMRSLAFAYVWEHWPTTTPTGAPA